MVLFMSGGGRIHSLVVVSVFFLFSLCLVGRVTSYGVVPSLHPLKYITPDAVFQLIGEKVQGAVWSSLLPVDQQDAVAIFISEGISGFMGGIALKVISSIDGNRNNRDSSLANGESSGVYFGTIGALRSLAQLAGLSSISVNLLSIFFAAGVSELVKARTRLIAPYQTRVGKGPTMYELMKFKNPSMLDLMKFAKNENAEITPRMKMMGSVTETEIWADFSKWAVFYLTVPISQMDRLEDSLIVGSVAGLISQLVRERKDEELQSAVQSYKRASRKPSPPTMSKQPGYWFVRWRDKTKKLLAGQGVDSLRDGPVLRVARSCLETSVQLLTYEEARRYVMEVGPYFQAGRLADFFAS